MDDNCNCVFYEYMGGILYRRVKPTDNTWSIRRDNYNCNCNEFEWVVWKSVLGATYGNIWN